MPTITMPALSPTMEAGTLARWLKAVGDAVRPGDVLAEIETDKATMEVEAIDEGVLTRILVPDGTEEVKVGTPIAVIAGEDEDAVPAAQASRPSTSSGRTETGETARAEPVEARAPSHLANGHAAPSPRADAGRILASPLARRIAELRGIDLSGLTGSGPNGRIVKVDVDAARPSTPGLAAGGPPPRAGEEPKPAAPVPPPQGEGDRAQRGGGVSPPAAPPRPAHAEPVEAPHESVKLSNMRKVIARRLTESKQTVPHYYLAIDCRLDALLKLRADLNAALEPTGVKLSVNDLLIKALALALRQVPDANVSFTPDALIKYSRADISVAVAIPQGLITPVIVGADAARLSDIATQMKTLAARAKEGKLQPHEYQGGTASLSNLGMYGIKQFEAVINPPQGMILAVGAGDRRPWVEGDQLVAATVMTATGSFDHRAIDGAVGAELMAAFKVLVEAPLAMLA